MSPSITFSTASLAFVAPTDNPHSTTPRSPATEYHYTSPLQLHAETKLRPRRSASFRFWVKEAIRLKLAADLHPSLGRQSSEPWSAAGSTVDLLSERELFKDMGGLRSTKSSPGGDDYLTARAANPRTGMVSPSATSLMIEPTPSSPADALRRYSPCLPTTGQFHHAKTRSPSSSQRWRCDDSGWWTESTPSPSPASLRPLPNSRACLPKPRHRSSIPVQPNYQPPEPQTFRPVNIGDRLIVHMPSAQEPQPYAYPGYSSSQIQAAQKRSSRASLPASRLYSMPGSFLTSEASRVAELDASPSSSPPLLVSSPASTDIAPPSGTVIQRKPVRPGCLTLFGAPRTSHADDLPPSLQIKTLRPGKRPPLERASISVGLGIREQCNPQLESNTPDQLHPISTTSEDKVTSPRSKLTASLQLPRTRQTKLHPLRPLPQTRQLEAAPSEGIAVRQIYRILLALYVLVCVWCLLDALCRALRTMMFPVRLVWYAGRWMIG